uniref:C2H2-type domain-containing protein n=1 Tax=Trachysalambria curvirostris nimavirus TaxID=2984282 RepID=A0A9C7BNF3_9VIRU|nr:MAG: hypothetical protein [Trachysalambria curvirostris nimavirus]
MLIGKSAAKYIKDEVLESSGNKDLLVSVTEKAPDSRDDSAEFELVWGEVGIELEAAGTSRGSKDKGAATPSRTRAEENVLPSRFKQPMTYVPMKLEEDMLHLEDKVPMTHLPDRVENALRAKSVAPMEGFPIKMEPVSPSRDEAEVAFPYIKNEVVECSGNEDLLVSVKEEAPDPRDDSAEFELVWGDVGVELEAAGTSRGLKDKRAATPFRMRAEEDVLPSRSKEPMTYVPIKVEEDMLHLEDKVPITHLPDRVDNALRAKSVAPMEGFPFRMVAFLEMSKGASEKEEAEDAYSSPQDGAPIDNTEAINMRLECENSEGLKSLEERAQEGRERPHKCDVCARRYVLRQGLKRHMRLHSKERLHICDVCGKVFLDKSGLMTHMRSHTKEKPFTCETCNKSFSTKSTLMNHRVVHTNKRPFKCGNCKKAFIWKAGLDRHMNIHTKEKRFACDTCHKAFNDKSTLVTHLLIHTNVRPFECHICCKAFVRRRHLVRHLNVHALVL